MVFLERKGWKMMFKPNELRYFLFHKKICPICHDKLERIVKKDNVGWEHTVSGGKVNMYEYKNYYYCHSCNMEFSLNDLSKRIRKP